MLPEAAYEYGVVDERPNKSLEVLTINTGRRIFLLTVKRPYHNWKYESSLEEMLTDINFSCITTELGHQDQFWRE
jgi:hypothetical protein